VWLSFLIAGTVATLQGYAVAKLGALTAPREASSRSSSRASGKGHISAITSWLLYFAALIVTGMVSVSFGNYASALFFGESSSPGWSKVLATAVVLAVAAVNIARARFIDRVQSAIVVVLLAVFAIFMVVTLAQTNPQLLARRPTRRQWT
jgi:amino acid transporter